MADRIEAVVKPELLVWARKSASLSLEAAAKRAHVKPNQLKEWEAGTSRPTINQLRLLADAFKRPLAVFYLSKPPEAFDALHDFRRMEAQSEQSPALAYEIRRANERRNIALDLLDDLGEGEPTAPEVATKPSNIEDVSRKLRDVLGITVADQMKWQSESVAFSRWRDAVENAGTLVFQMSGVKVSEARGFSIPARPLPVIAVNGKDAYVGRIFTLMHELAHIAIREGGVCDLDDHGVEIFCNAVAGALLVPADELLGHREVAGRHGAWPDDVIQRLAHTFRVSKEVVVRRLLTLGRTNAAFYQKKREQYAAEFIEKPSKGGPSQPVVAVARAGRFFTGVVVRSYRAGRITSADASDFLNLKVRYLPDVMKSLRVSIAA